MYSTMNLPHLLLPLLLLMLHLHPLILATHTTPLLTPSSYFDTLTPYSSTPSTFSPTVWGPSRVVYDDEDPEAARLAWFKGRAEQARAGGRWRYVERRLRYPTDSLHGADEGHLGEGIGVGETHRAGGGDKGKGPVAMERGAGAGAGGRETPEPSIGGSGSDGRRFEDEGGRTRSGLTRHSIGRGSSAPSAPPLPPTLDHPLPPSRADSPTRQALNAAASQLSSLADPQLHSSSSSSLSADSPPYHPLPHKPHLIAPYRLWSAKSALPTINLAGFTKLTDRYPLDFDHWHSTLSTLSSHEWTVQLSNRLQWAAAHRMDSSRPARVVTPFGALTGGDIATAEPSYVYDAKDPPPKLDSVELTRTGRRVNAWKELAGMFPPALTGHSRDVWRSHREGGWGRVAEGWQDAVHPVQYVGQMLRERDGAVVLENAIHAELGGDVPQEVVAALQREREGRTRQGQTVEEMLGTEYATYNRFWYPYYHNKPAFRIKNPLDTPLEQFVAFAPFADAVALKKV